MNKTTITIHSGTGMRCFFDRANNVHVCDGYDMKISNGTTPSKKNRVWRISGIDEVKLGSFPHAKIVNMPSFTTVFPGEGHDITCKYDGKIFTCTEESRH